MLLAGYRQDWAPKQTPAEAHRVTVWDVKTGKRLQVLTGHDGNICFVGFLPDSKRAVTAGGSTLKIWDAREGKQLWSGTVSPRHIEMVALSPDGQRVLTWGGGSGKEGVDNCTFLLWEARTGKLLRAFEGYEKVLIRRLAFTPDSKKIHVASDSYGRQEDIYLRILDAADGKTLDSFKRGDAWKYPLAFSPDGKLALSEKRYPGIGPSAYLVLWDLASGKVVRRFEDRSGSDDDRRGALLVSHHTVVFTPDGKRVLSGDGDGEVRIWDATSGKVTSSVQLLDNDSWGIGAQRKGPPEKALAWLFSPDGKMALTSSGQKPSGTEYPSIMFSLWDVSNGKLLRRFHCEPDYGDEPEESRDHP